ncbi:hypothetical protein ACFO4N_12950 [Camelliibacillus cellulosilyticus]|uniref:BNR/Asp-box repeat protein n=1 Tax=Camelliibacillus cellulosilyticus TaxID=2174486 RepID=A0ABV9GRQ0_9BACL
MNEKLRRLRKDLDHSLLKDLHFTEEHKKAVFRAIGAKRRRRFFRWLPSMAAVRSVISFAACVIFLIGTLFYAFGAYKQLGDQQRNDDSQQGSAPVEKQETGYLVTFKSPATIQEIEKLQTRVGFNLAALKYSYPIGERLPVAGTYLLRNGDTLAKAADAAKSHLFYDLDNQIRLTVNDQQLAKIKPHLSKLMMSVHSELKTWEKTYTNRFSREPFRFTAMVVTADPEAVEALEKNALVTSVKTEPLETEPVYEPYPAEENGRTALDETKDAFQTVKKAPDGTYFVLSKHQWLMSKDGISWKAREVEPLKTGSLVSSAFVGTGEAWLYVRQHAETRLYHTADGGQRWTNTKPPFQGNGEMFFLNKKDGWFLETANQDATLFQTHDGGASWLSIAYTKSLDQAHGTIPQSGKKSQLVFTDARHGWLTALDPGGSDIHLYKTADQGKTWRPATIDLPKTYRESENTITGPVFKDKNHGFFLVNARYITKNRSEFVLYTTADGGRSWHRTEPMSYDNGTEVQVDEAGGNIYVVDGKSLYVTKNEGKRWIKGGLVVDNQINRIVTPLALKMVNDRQGLMLIRDQDGGTRPLVAADASTYWLSVTTPK